MTKSTPMLIQTYQVFSSQKEILTKKVDEMKAKKKTRKNLHNNKQIYKK